MEPGRVPSGDTGSASTVLVTAANGRTGRAVVSALARAGAVVCALVRREDQREALLALGAQGCVIGDLADRVSLDRAMRGCAKVVHIGPPLHPDEVAMTANVLAAAQAAGVGHVIYYSVMHPQRRALRHHRLKLEAEERVIESGTPYTILEPIRYMQHLEPIWTEVVGDGIHAMPFDVDARFSLVDLTDLAGATAKVTLCDDHLYATYELAGPESLSSREMAAILAEELDRPVEARAIPIDALERSAKGRGLPADRIEQMLAMNRHYDRHGFLGNARVLTGLLGRQPNDFRSYVRRLKAAAHAGQRGTA
jgi:uncharacterized protein YbjT (DUF2867 family)